MFIDHVHIILLITKAFVRNCTALLSPWFLVFWLCLFLTSFFFLPSTSNLGGLNHFAFFHFTTPTGALLPSQLDPYLKPSEISFSFSSLQTFSIVAIFSICIPLFVLAWSHFEGISRSTTPLVQRKPSAHLQLTLVSFIVLSISAALMPTTNLTISILQLFFVLKLFIFTLYYIQFDFRPPQKNLISSHSKSHDEYVHNLFFQRLLMYLCASFCFSFILFYTPLNWSSIFHLLTSPKTSSTFFTHLITFFSWSLLLLTASLFYTRLLFKGVTLPVAHYLYRQLRNPKHKLALVWNLLLQKGAILFSTTEEEQNRLDQLRIAKHTKSGHPASKGTKRL